MIYGWSSRVHGSDTNLSPCFEVTHCHRERNLKEIETKSEKIQKHKTIMISNIQDSSNVCSFALWNWISKSHLTLYGFTHELNAENLFGLGKFWFASKRSHTHTCWQLKIGSTFWSWSLHWYQEYLLLSSVELHMFAILITRLTWHGKFSSMGTSR